MQDIHLGLLIAVLPALAGHKGVAPHRSKVHELLHGSDIVGSGEYNFAFFSSVMSEEIHQKKFLICSAEELKLHKTSSWY